MAVELIAYKPLADYLGLSGFSIADYPALDVIRGGVAARIAGYLGRDLLVDPDLERTVSLWAETPRRIFALPAIPAISLISVDLDGVEVEAEPTPYGLRLASAGAGVLTVSYQGGLTAIPDGIARAALIQTAYEWQSKDAVGAESVSTSGGTISRPSLRLLPEVRESLLPYMHPLRVAA